MLMYEYIQNVVFIFFSNIQLSPLSHVLKTISSAFKCPSPFQESSAMRR
jgi:hypothetical protein